MFIERIKNLDGDPKMRADQFVTQLIGDLDAAVQSSDIQRVRDLSAELRDNHDDVVAALTGSGGRATAGGPTGATTVGDRQHATADAGKSDRR